MINVGTKAQETVLATCHGAASVGHLVYSIRLSDRGWKPWSQDSEACQRRAKPQLPSSVAVQHPSYSWSCQDWIHCCTCRSHGNKLERERYFFFGVKRETRNYYSRVCISKPVFVILTVKGSGWDKPAYLAIVDQFITKRLISCSYLES